MTAVAMDRAGGPSASDDELRALPAERLDGAAAPSPRASADRWVGVAATVALHLAILAALFARAWTPEAAPTMREIPVELVVEPPPPSPSPVAPPSPQPSAAARPLDLEPAHDAPRAATEEEKDRDAPDAKTKAPASPTPEATPAAPTPPADATPSPSATPPTPGEATPQPTNAPNADQAAERTAALPNDGGPLPANDATPDASAAPAANRPSLVGQPFPSWSKSKPFSTFEAPPDIAFAAPAEKSESPISGEARKTYLTVLYGMIMSHLRLTDRMRVDSQHVEGKIDFVVDGHGAIIERSVAQPSGSPDLDAAALEAVAEAAPYPTPPQGLPLRLTFTYGAK